MFAGLQPWLRPWAEELMRVAGSGLKVTSVYRSYTEQMHLYLTRWTNPFPVAPPGQSYHNHGRAWDMVGDQARLAYAGAVWNSWGGTWSPSDPIHFQA